MYRQTVFFSGLVALSLVLVHPRPTQAQEDLRSALARVECAPITLLEVGRVDEILQVTLDSRARELKGREQRREDLIRDLLWAARQVHPDLAGIRIMVRPEHGPSLSLANFLEDKAQEQAIRETNAGRQSHPRNLPPQDLPYGGSLQGRTIALSPGHGWTWYDNLNDWGYQRSLINMPGCESCLGIIEDLSNNQIAIRHVIPHLLRAGAQVWSVRERDFSDWEYLLDDGDVAVVEQGSWSDGSSAGGYGADYRVLQASTQGLVEYPLEPERAGVYWVSITYVAGQNRVADAQVVIEHDGGTVQLQLDQRQNGSRWIQLGAWPFKPGAGNKLVLSPGPSARDGEYLIADAVRLGGGRDQTQVSGIAADRARWKMSARFNLPYFGLPDAVHTGSDVTVRPAWAEWQGADLYLSLHSNASGGSTSSASGTSTYRFNCYDYPDHSSAPDPSLCDDPPGSDLLQRSVHESMLQFLRAHWDPNWRDRGRLVANFGEMRVLDQIPGALIESAFHDGTSPASADMLMADNQALQDPRFRFWLGYAIYAGLTRFFDPEAVLLPAQAPQGLHLTQAATGGLHLAWDPVPEAQGYRVRYAINGVGLGEGVHTEDNFLTFDERDPGMTLAARVSALNSGGEGPPSEWVMAHYRGHGAPADVLLVSGFDRQDAFIGDGHNQNDQILTHGLAIKASGRGVYFDSASNEALESGVVQAQDYRALIWILGEESTTDETFSELEQDLVDQLLDSGIALMASGAEIGWDLVEQGQTEDQVFFDSAFDTIYLHDDGDSYQAHGVGIFAGVGDVDFDDGSHGIYPVEWPDVFEPLSSDAQAVMAYPDGTGAAVASTAGDTPRLLLGFPFETVYPESARTTLMDAALEFLLPGHSLDDYDRDGLPDVWEDEHDLDPTKPSAEEDPDGDGFSNLEEFENGTNPKVPQEDSPDGGFDGGDTDDAHKPKSGCGCSSGAPCSAEAWLILLGLAAWTLRRRREH